MGQVYEVERLTDGGRLALKVLNGVATSDALARFAREAQIAAELEHPNVVSVLDVGVSRSGMLFLVMELVHGASLSAERSRYGDTPWAVSIVHQIARALAAMHARGIIHRDLKPANILLDGGTAKVADFGLASLTTRASVIETPVAVDVASPELTRTGAIMGTPLYMAPELVQGAREAAPSSDVFSLGVVAYQLFARDLPHSASPVLERLNGRAPPPPKQLAEARPDLPVELCSLIDQCLAETPSSRPPAREIVSTLDRISPRE
jgi:serine/threonine protein kinase